MPIAEINADPRRISLDTQSTALIVIDMQRDFLEPGGFGAALGNDVSRLRSAIAPCRRLLAAGALYACGRIAGEQRLPAVAARGAHPAAAE